MGSLLIVGGTRGEREQKALAIAQNYNISQFDTFLVKPTDDKIGIGEIRELKNKLNLKPFNSKFKLAVIFDFELGTPEAQNAFLKTLEEPPENTIIVLTARNADLLLPTIVSRCQVISLQTTDYSLPKAQISNLISGGVGDKLKLAQDNSKAREDALEFLEQAIISVRQTLIGDIFKNKNHLISRHLNILMSFQKTHRILSTTNVSPRFTLETLFLSG